MGEIGGAAVLGNGACESADGEDHPPEPARFVIQNRQRALPVDRRGLADFLEGVADDVAPGDRRGATVRIVPDEGIRLLNRCYRNRDGPTDVLAFPADPFPPGEPPYLGDLVISAETAVRQARARGWPLHVELRTLALHGLLHLFGYDHERDHGEMARLERLLRRRHGLDARGGSE